MKSGRKVRRYVKAKSLVTFGGAALLTFGFLSSSSGAAAKSKDRFSDYFGGKPSKRDLACFDSCKRKGHSCGAVGGGKIKKTLKLVEVTGDCTCFDVVDTPK
jgi:hypothetical protein